jgi:NADH-quinone oxidoreductase subunit J
MTPEQVVFLISAAWILASALMVVITRNLLHAALWLVSALFGVAVLFAVLNASFLAVVQVVVYIGAIAVLFIFAVMLTRKDLRDRGPQTRSTWWIPAFLGILILAGLAFLILGQPAVNRTAPVIAPGVDPLQALGMALVSTQEYVLPFEAASVLLLAALVGAVYIAVGRKP